MSNLLGVDFGTTSLKACLFNEKGDRLAFENVKYDLITTENKIEFPAEKFYEIFLSVFDKIASKFSIDSMAIDTQGETLIMLDKFGNPLMNAIIWLDNRAVSEAKEMSDYFGNEKIYNLTGQAEIPSSYPAPKILWIKNNFPLIFEKVDKFMLLEDFIIYKLINKACASRSLYSSSLLMNIHTGKYIKEILDYLSIDESKLSRLYESGECVGEYKGTKVCISALDQIAGATGAGIVTPDIISETTGTALAVVAITENFPLFYENIKVSAYYLKKGYYCLLMWAPTAGATLEWFKKNFAEEVSYKKLNELASEIPAGSEGLICLPHLCGSVMPENNDKIKGVFFGAQLKHNKAHFVRAIMESIAYCVKEFIQYLKVKPKEIRSMGGGANSELWCQIKSAVLNKEITTLKENETACLGSAIFAGIGINEYKDTVSASKLIVKKQKTYLYKNENYKKLYKDYKIKEKKLIKIF